MSVLTSLSPATPAPTASALEALLADIRARRSEFEARQSVSPDIIEAFQAHGVYRAMVSKRFGGDAKSPAEFCRLIETISQADGSAGWVASFGAAATYLACLPLETLEAIYANGPDVVFAGGLFPPQAAVRTEAGLRVSGRWKFGSGSPGASLIGVGVVIKDDDTGGLPRMAVMSADKVRIQENWNVIGMQGTGSHDLIVENVVVPEAWTFIRGGEPALDEPLYRYPSMALAAQVLAVVGLGVARAAIDEISLVASAKTSITGAPQMGQRPWVQIEIARQEALLCSARAWFYEATETLWAKVLTDEALAPRDVLPMRLASIHAAQVAAQVAQAIFRLAGTTSIYLDHPLSRHVRDAMVVAQHAFLSEGHYQGAGRILLGGESLPGFP